MKTKERILELVGKALNAQFETYSWEKMIDDTPSLTKAEKAWAKKHIDYKAYMLLDGLLTKEDTTLIKIRIKGKADYITTPQHFSILKGQAKARCLPLSTYITTLINHKK